MDLDGTSASETLYGTTGADRLNAKTGNDYIAGSDGNDVYLFAAGDGQDRIYDTSGADSIQFDSSVSRGDIRLTASYGNSLSLHNDQAGDEIEISSFFYGTSYRVETVRFSDGSTLDLTQPLTLTGTSAAETLYGSDGADTLDAKAGNDLVCPLRSGPS